MPSVGLDTPCLAAEAPLVVLNHVGQLMGQLQPAHAPMSVLRGQHAVLVVPTVVDLLRQQSRPVGPLHPTSPTPPQLTKRTIDRSIVRSIECSDGTFEHSIAAPIERSIKRSIKPSIKCFVSALFFDHFGAVFHIFGGVFDLSQRRF